MATTHTVTLTLANGPTPIDTWDRAIVSLSMLRAGQPWTVSCWRTTTDRTTWEVLARRVRLMDRATLSIDGHPQLVGRIETWERHAEGHGESLAVLSGRDLAGVAQSWDVNPTIRIRNAALEDALRDIFGGMDLDVRITPAAAAREVQSARRPGARGTGTRPRRSVVDIAHPRVGEKAWQTAEHIVRRLGFMLWIAPRTDGSVGIVVDAPDYTQAPSYALTRTLDARGVGGGNILGGSEVFSTQEVPTAVAVYTGSVRGTGESARSRASIVNEPLFDPAVNRGFVLEDGTPQPVHMRSDRARTLEAATREAHRTIASAMAGFRRYKCSVQGFGQRVQGEDRLYAVNTIATVRDDLMIDAEGRGMDERMLITDVEFTHSRKEGQTTNLTLVPLGSIVVTPEV